MKKYLIPGVLVLMTHFAAVAQTDGYRVVRIVGAVESTKLNRALKTEDVIPTGDNLKFKSDKDYLIVFSPKGGRKRIVGVPDSQPRELSALLQSFVKPDERSTATRGSDPAYIDVIKSDFSEKVLILGNGIVELDPQFVSLEPPKSVKAQYKTTDNKNVVVRVSSGQSIRLDQSTLFPGGGMPAGGKILLLYYEVDSSNPMDSKELLGNFAPVYVSDDVLIPETKAIIESMKGTDPKIIEGEVSNYLTQEYAKPSTYQLHAWLKSNRLLP